MSDQSIDNWIILFVREDKKMYWECGCECGCFTPITMSNSTCSNCQNGLCTDYMEPPTCKNCRKKLTDGDHPYTTCRSCSIDHDCYCYEESKEELELELKWIKTYSWQEHAHEYKFRVSDCF